MTTLCKTGTEDVYRLPIGIRTVDIKDTKFLINDQQFYFRGFGRHEDANVSLSICVYCDIANDEIAYRMFPGGGVYCSRSFPREYAIPQIVALEKVSDMLFVCHTAYGLL